MPQEFLRGAGLMSVLCSITARTPRCRDARTCVRCYVTHAPSYGFEVTPSGFRQTTMPRNVAGLGRPWTRLGSKRPYSTM